MHHPTDQQANQTINEQTKHQPISASNHVSPLHLNCRGRVCLQHHLEPDCLRLLCRGRIKTMMATGDHPITALTVALSCGMMSPDVKRVLMELPHATSPTGAFRDGASCARPGFQDAAMPIHPTLAAKMKLPPLTHPPSAPLGSTVSSNRRLGSLPASKPLLGSPRLAKTSSVAAELSSARDGSPPKSDFDLPKRSPTSEQRIRMSTRGIGSAAQGAPGLTAGAQVPRLLKERSALLNEPVLLPPPRQPDPSKAAALQPVAISGKPSKFDISLSLGKVGAISNMALDAMVPRRPRKVAQTPDPLPNPHAQAWAPGIWHAQSSPPGFARAVAAEQSSAGDFELGNIELAHAQSAGPELAHSEFQQVTGALGLTPALADVKCTLGSGASIRPVKISEAMTVMAEGGLCIMTGPVFQHLLQHAEPAELELILRSTLVCARMRSHQKPQLVQLLGSAGVRVSATRFLPVCSGHQSA